MTSNKITIAACSHFVRRSLALAAFAALAGTALSIHAQQAVSASNPPARTLNLDVPVADTGRDAIFSSSADNEVAEVAAASSHFDFLDAARDTQPPPRRGYGRPRYRGGNTNPDGSNKYGFLAGVGLAQPVSDTYSVLTPSYGLQVGGGRNFDRYFGMMLQFDYDHFGFTGKTLAQQQYILNNPNVFAGQISGLDGSSHVWSLTVDPTYNLNPGAPLGAYVVGGFGFYHKTANFTVPATATYCNFFGCFQYAANQTVDKYTSNAPGFNAGFGLTYKISRFSNERLYGEIRYVYVANQQKPGFTVANYNSITPTSTNLFPANSARTTYMPVKFGIRF